MLWKRVAAISTLLLSPACLQAQSQDCELAARYHTLAARAADELRQEDQYRFLERAANACAEHRYWYELGELAVLFGTEEMNERAAEAFVRAYELTDDARLQASTIASYARLLFDTNQRQQALTYIYAARNLDPANEDIAALASRFATAAEIISEEDVVRGLSAMRLKPLRLMAEAETPSQQLAGGEVGGGGGGPGGRGPGGPGGAEGPGGPGGPGGAAAAPANVAPAPAVNIPIHFVFNSAELAEGSRRNVEVLARTLASRFADQAVTFIGHADVRGNAEANQRLSVARARQIYELVVQLEPGLAGRIEIVGKGAAEPLSLGNTEQDHQVNRRLEVRFR